MEIFNALQSFDLVLLLWNCWSILSNLSKFQHYVQKNNLHIICLCEIWLKFTDTFKLKGYNTYRKDRLERGGGLAILIKDTIQSYHDPNYCSHYDGKLESLVITIQFNNSSSDVCLLYNPCQTILADEFNYYFNSLSNNSLILGDFNAHHTLWDSRLFNMQVNNTGKSLLDSYSTNTNFNLLTPNALGTFYDVKTNKDSTIDLVFGSGILNTADSFKDNLMGSDHYPIFYCFYPKATEYNTTSPLSWQMKKINWAVWSDALSSGFQNGLTYSLSYISDKILETTRTYTNPISKKHCPKYSKPFWSAECSRLVALRRRLLSRYKQHPTPENKRELNKRVAYNKRYFKQQKKLAWLQFCETLDHSSSNTKVWSLFKKIESKPVFDFRYPLSQNNLFVTDNFIKSSMFADHFSTIFSNVRPILNFDFKAQSLQIAYNLNFNASYNSLFQLQELRRAISSLNPASAMGSDLIHNLFLIHLPTSLYKVLLDAINDSWIKGLLPSDHKISTLLPILKPGKDPKKVCSYRPIALLSCLGKLIEKMVFCRLYTYFESTKRIPTFQCGFRRHNSCLDILIHLEHYIQMSLKTKQVMLVVFLDIKQAFDSCNHINLLYGLLQNGIKGRALKWLADFFSGRYFNVRIGNSYSNDNPVLTGVPQGSILSPLLFH